MSDLKRKKSSNGGESTSNCSSVKKRLRIDFDWKPKGLFPNWTLDVGKEDLGLPLVVRIVKEDSNNNNQDKNEMFDSVGKSILCRVELGMQGDLSAFPGLDFRWGCNPAGQEPVLTDVCTPKSNSNTSILWRSEPMLMEIDDEGKMKKGLSLAYELEFEGKPSGINLEDTLSIFWEEDILTDLTLICQGRKIRCHRLVLAAKSPVFKAMLTQNPMKDVKGEAVIKIDDMTVGEAKDMVLFMYLGSVSNLPRNALGLVRTAEKYGLPKLANICEHFLGNHLNVDNMVKIWAAAVKGKRDKLKAKVVDFMKEKRGMIKENRQMKELFAKEPALVCELVCQLL